MVSSTEEYFTQGCGRCPRFATLDCSIQTWKQGLLELRAICLEVGLNEAIKWGHPCYLHQGRNIAIVGAFRKDFRLTFFEAGLLQDEARVLEKSGPNCATAEAIRFAENGQVGEMADTLRAYLREAMGYAEQGLKAAKPAVEMEFPDELLEALQADPELAQAFYALTPGRQRSYLILLGSAKKSETRLARIESSRSRILAGKGAQER